MKKLHLTLASGDYESIRALKEGTVQADGIELTVLTHMTSDVRHWRMLRNREFDVAELSMSNYLMAKYTGLPFTAIPVFPHRKFCHGNVLFNTASGIVKPEDFAGKVIGMRAHFNPVSLWMRGVLEVRSEALRREAPELPAQPEIGASGGATHDRRVGGETEGMRVRRDRDRSGDYACGEAPLREPALVAIPTGDRTIHRACH